jgi:hypothetical protein
MAVEETAPPPSIDGSPIVGIRSRDEQSVVVTLEDGRTSTIPSDNPLAELLAGIPAAEPTSAEINGERDRRIATMTFAERTYQTDPESQRNIIAMGANAKFALIMGAPVGSLRWASPDADFAWIDADNNLVPMDAQTMSSFADAASRHVMVLIMAGRALKDQSPIPADFRSDIHWPSG